MSQRSRFARPLGLAEGAVELGNVEGPGGVGQPLDARRVRPQISVGVGERLAELVQKLPQAVAGIRLRGLRPEREGELRPRLAGVGVQEQVREERLDPPGHRRVQGRTLESQAERAEEVDLERAFHVG
jgi:hypothetical protein